MAHISSTSEKFLARLRSVLGDALLCNEADCLAYSYDNSRGECLPMAVTLPSDSDQVREIIMACHASKVPLVARGRGTGTAGAAIPPKNGVVISFERLDRIIAIDTDNRVAVVQPGVINAVLQAALADHGFFWPPDPGSAAFCTIGGNLACNAAGPRTVKYGTPRENTLGLRAITGDGSRLRTGCYTTKGVVGYDFTRLLIGSEGTLAVITEATLKLTPLADATRTLRVDYGDINSAARAVSQIMAQPVIPAALEFMDSAAVDLIRDQIHDLSHQTRAMLLIDVDGSRDAMDGAVKAISVAAQTDGLIAVHTACDDSDNKNLWAARKALSPALRGIAAKKISEDIVVPVSKLAELINRLADLSSEHGIHIVNYGHAGNGNIHVNFLFDPNNPQQCDAADVCLNELFRMVLHLGGTLSGEHGIGLDKRQFVSMEIEPATLALMRRVKDQFDPDGILNPGKLFPDE